MQKYGKWLGAGAIVVASLATISGCADRNNDGVPASPATTEEIDNSVENAGNAVASAADNAADATASAVNNAAPVVENMADAAATTPKVKTALGANAAMEGSNINVTTNNNQVILSGTVKNAAQKKLAGDIATKNGNGYKVVNNLRVTGSTTPKM